MISGEIEVNLLKFAFNIRTEVYRQSLDLGEILWTIQALEEDFVDMRKEDSKTVNADSFTLLLTTARYESNQGSSPNFASYTKRI